ncbi:hypothetical protein A3J15_01685 [Candidatus Roizmanbacteria bacterium RIFCSPLOWO2_02_FULL_38_10]|uniref:DUF4258 domain-containing protein n=1 Tax=Candidatus Roizmanbacteria bacterium RIFCSPLOWO2_02_FULL_38_10 TaxID=1802074 RepID=A0A1F7JKN7_9BACT|nr:MAG: hypothetical protein A3J15_01685 [Candidatus Roizmanbacteria bacterium RIFCSPLOWO2_02_FULL_38_10]
MKIIFTNNALNKIHQDNLSKEILYETITNSHQVSPGREPGVNQYRRNWDFGTVTAIAKRTDRGEILVITCFAKYNDPKFYRTQIPKAKKPPFFERILLAFLKRLGL